MDVISNKVKGIMGKVNSISEKNGLPTPYLVGGYVRNLFFGEESIEDDLDFTANSGPNSLFLGILYAKETNSNFQIFERKHASVYHDSTKLDFSSGFISENLPENIDDYMKEPMSRDFTINSVHIKCDDFSIYDFTGRGLDDLKNRFLDTIMEPKKTFIDDPKRIYRALYISSKYNLKISERVLEYCKDLNLEDFIKENSRFIISIVDKSFKASNINTIKNIEALNLYGKIPIFGEFRTHLIDSGKLEDYFGGSL
tara:strand:+ start:4870 stop:5634 length:765 start_codon:yes stop_codon:yes gene_type:complete